MKKFVGLFVSVLVVGATAYGAQVTDYVNDAGNTSTGGTGVDPDTLSGNSYVGSQGASAAKVSNISGLQVTESSFSGGSAGSVTVDDSISIEGGAGLEVSTVDQTTVSSSMTIAGGSGGDLTMSTPGTRFIDSIGGHGILFSSTDPADKLDVQKGTLAGGLGGTVKGAAQNTVSANGGSALYADNGSLSVANATLKGGKGGSASVEDGVASAMAGHGLDVNFSFVNIDPIPSGVSVAGGDGGSADAGDGESADASAGNGVNLRWQLGLIAGDKPIVVEGGDYTGGAGGSANSGGISTANGGIGFAMLGGQSVVISNGTFSGGAGGSANSTSTDDISQADGGAGAHIVFANQNIFGSGAAKADILGGVFNGGSAGRVNGASGQVGYGLVLESSDTLIDGNVEINGRGLRVDSFGIPSKTLIKNGNISEIIFTSEVNPVYPTFPASLNTFAIEGGTIGNVYVEGVAGNNGTITGGTMQDIMVGGSADNVLAFGGTASYEDLYLGGSAATTLSLSNGVSSSGMVLQSAGTTDVNIWNDAHFQNTTIANATMNFNNQSFNLGNGEMLELQDENSTVNFNGGATIGNGATLDIGLGTVGGAGNFVSEGGSTLKTWLVDNASGGIDNGILQGENLTFEDGTFWVVDGPAGNAVDRIQLASATGTIVDNGIDFDYTAARLWWLGIVGTTVESGNFYADLGDLDWNEALDAPPGSEYDKAMSEISLVATNGTEGYDILTSISTKEAAQEITAHNWVRTAEMASSMMSFQAIIANQVKDRTRTHIGYKNNSLADANMAPSGAAGPDSWYNNSMNWLNDRLPTFGGNASDKQISSGSSTKGSGYDSTMNWLNDSKPRLDQEIGSVPDTYQVWGRGFGSRIKQDDTRGHAGYDADVYGAIIGLDKRFNDVLAGVGAGYGSTRVEGDAGNDGDADTGFGVGYLSVAKGDLFIDASVSYGYSTVDVETHLPSNAGYEGDYDAQTAGFYLGGGYGMSILKDTLLLTPEASILATYYDREEYTEKSSVYNDKKFDSYDEWSYRSAVGATLTMVKKIESLNLEMSFQPELRVHWIHEFNDELDEESYKFVGIPGGGQSIGVALQAREEDLVRLGAGARFASWDSSNTELGVDVDGEIGSDYEAIIVSAKLLHRF